MIETKENKKSTKGMSVTELTDYIQSLKGKERQKFCQTLSKEEKIAYIKCLRDKESEKVKGVYRCMIPLGGAVKFSCRMHKGDIETYDMIDGQEYEVPLSVAKHLRDNCWFPEHAHTLDANGSPKVTVGKKHNTHNFEPSGFFIPSVA